MSLPEEVDVLAGLRLAQTAAAKAEVRVAELEKALADLCYEAYVVIKANSTLEMSGRKIKPGFKRLSDAHDRASKAYASTGDSVGTDPRTFLVQTPEQQAETFIYDDGTVQTAPEFAAEHGLTPKVQETSDASPEPARPVWCNHIPPHWTLAECQLYRRNGDVVEPRTNDACPEGEHCLDYDCRLRHDLGAAPRTLAEKAAQSLREYDRRHEHEVEVVKAIAKWLRIEADLDQKAGKYAPTSGFFLADQIERGEWRSALDPRTQEAPTDDGTLCCEEHGLETHEHCAEIERMLHEIPGDFLEGEGDAPHEAVRRMRLALEEARETAQRTDKATPARTYEEGVADAAADIADWIRSAIAGGIFGSESWSLRRSLGESISKGTWRDPNMIDARVLQRTRSK